MQIMANERFDSLIAEYREIMENSKVDWPLEEIEKYEESRRQQDSFKRVYINVYSVTRHYGGPEEGGWWYNRVEIMHSERPVNVHDEVFKRRDALLKEYRDQYEEGDIYSMRGGLAVVAYVETGYAESQRLERPHYE